MKAIIISLLLAWKWIEVCVHTLHNPCFTAFVLTLQAHKLTTRLQSAPPVSEVGFFAWCRRMKQRKANILPIRKENAAPRWIMAAVVSGTDECEWRLSDAEKKCQRAAARSRWKSVNASFRKRGGEMLRKIFKRAARSLWALTSVLNIETVWRNWYRLNY